MRVIVLIFIALAVIAAGGAGAYFYFGKDAVAASGHDSHPQKAKAEKEPHFEFVELDPLILPILDGNGVHQVVSFVVAVEVHDAAGAARVELLSPRLNDAYIQDLYGMLNRHATREGGAIEVGKVKKRLNEITNRVLGEGVASDVLLQVVQQRPI